MSKMDFDQLCALREIERARMKLGLPGFHDDIQTLVDRYKDGASALKSNNPRLIQAKVLWDKGVGQNVIIGFDSSVPGLDGFGEFNENVPGYPVWAKSFEEYLATIPEIPEALLADDPNLPLLRLVDPRAGLVKTCELFGILFKEFSYSDEDVVAFDTRHEIPNTPFWVRAHDGRKNRNCKPNVCREECKDKLYAMTAMVAIMVWVQDPSIIKENEHVLDCPGSVRRADGCCAYLHVCGGVVRLVLVRHAGSAAPNCGAGSFRRE